MRTSVTASVVLAFVLSISSSHLNADSLMKNGHVVVIGWGEKSGTLIKWTDCDHNKGAQYETPPYWVDKNDNCKMSAGAFGISQSDARFVVADVKKFHKYFPEAQKGQEVSFSVVDHGVVLALNGKTLKLSSDVAPEGDVAPERDYRVAANSDITKRIEASAAVLNEIMATPDKAIPDAIMASAKCVAVVPSMVKIAIGFGGSQGKGVATCRTESGWSAPAPITIAGGSWGLQLGGQAIDLVLVVTNDQGMQHLLSSKFKLGADATAAAGPVGRDAAADTDWKMKGEVLTYSRARGVFAGIDLNGSMISEDQEETKLLYGKKIPLDAILSGKVRPPRSSEPFLGVVRKYAEIKKDQA